MAQTPPGKDPEPLCHGFYTPTVRVWLSTAHLAPSSVSNARGLLGQVTAPCSQTSARQVGAARGNAWLQGRGWVPSLGAADKPCPAVQELLALPVASSRAPPGCFAQPPPTPPASAELRTTLRKQTNPPKSGGSSSQRLGLPGEGSPALSSCVRAHQEGGGGNDSVFRLILFLAAAPMRSGHPLLPRRRCQRTVLSYLRRRGAPLPVQRRGRRQPRAFTVPALLPFGSKQITGLTSPVSPRPAVVNRFIATSSSFVLFQTPSCFTFKSQTRNFSAGRRKSMLKNTSTPQETASWDVVNKATETASPGRRAHHRVFTGGSGDTSGHLASHCPPQALTMPEKEQNQPATNCPSARKRAAGGWLKQ